MKYYLDTNAVYNLRKISESIISKSYTSVLTLIELVSGIKDENSYTKRKSILTLMFNMSLTIDWAMPEEIVFNSFNIFKEFEFIEDRTNELKKLIAELIKSETLKRYTVSEAYNSEFGHAYFENMDKSMSKRFIDSTDCGIKEIKKLLLFGASDNILEFEGKTFIIDSIKAINDFLIQFPQVNYMITINALASMIFKFLSTATFTLEDVFNSYNGLVNIYVKFISSYSIYKLTNQQLPAKNDLTDITHVLYLKDSFHSFIVSDDKIFPKFINDHVINYEKLILEN